MSKSRNRSSVVARDFQISSRKLDSLHKKLETTFANSLAGVSIQPRDSASEWRRWSSRRLEFFLHAAGNEFVVRGSGRNRQPVVPWQSLEAGFNSQAWWIGWYEAWDALGEGQFRFRAAGWSLYCGGVSQQEKTLVLRAEWGPFDGAGGCDHAGQPHWHSHMEVKMPAEVASVKGELGEEDSFRIGENYQDHYKARRLDFGGMHLAMAGWKNASTDPDRWQHPVSSADELVTELPVWAGATLVYFQEQISHVKSVS